MSGTELLIVLAAIVVGATIMGVLGFGFALVATPVMLLFVEPKSAVVTINAVTSITALLVLFQTRRHLKLRLAGGMSLGGLLTVPLGVLALDSADSTVLRMIVAVIILVLAVLLVSNVTLPFSKNPVSGPVLGFLAALAVTTLSVGGPLVALYALSQRWRPLTTRASLAFYFILFQTAALASYAMAGLITRDTVANVGLLLPGLLVGFGLATILAGRMNPQVFRYAATAVIILAGLVLLGREALRV